MKLGRPFLIACLLSALGAIFAVWLGVAALIFGGKSEYDPTIAVLTATLIAVIWYTYYTREVLQHARVRDEQERQRARRSLASGLLAELEWLENMLEQVYHDGPFIMYDIFEHPLLLQAISQSTLFNPVTVAKLSKFHALLRDVQNGVNYCRNMDPTQRRRAEAPLMNETMRVKAGFAIQGLPEICEALTSEGGELQKRVISPAVEVGKLPEIPQSPFGPRRRDKKPSENGIS